MRVMRTLFLAALALVSGCGGCDSCLTPQSFEEAGPAMTAPPALARPDGGAATRDEDAGRELPPKATAEPILLRDGGALARPKSPMPTGAFQACGVYDGPLCPKVCPKGACRQECDGVECELTCAGGYCSQLCGATARCKMTCNGGHCIQACTVAEGCTKECAGGFCE